VTFDQNILIEREYRVKAAEKWSNRVSDAGRILELEMVCMKVLFMRLKILTTAVISLLFLA